MEPRHHEQEADHMEYAENERTRDPDQEELGPDEDDTGYGAEIDGEPES